MSNVTAATSFSTMKQEDAPRYMQVFAEDVARTINGKLEFLLNMDAVAVSVTFSSANVDTSTSHSLKRVPIGYIVYGTTAAMSVYDGANASTALLLTLRSSATGTARVLIF